MSNSNVYASIGLEIPSRHSIYATLDSLPDDGFQFAVLPLVHPRFSRFKDVERYSTFSTPDQSLENLNTLYKAWTKHLIYRVDCSVKDLESNYPRVQSHAKELLDQELSFITYLSPRYVILSLNKSIFTNFANVIYSHAIKNELLVFCIKIPSHLEDDTKYRKNSGKLKEENTWDWWNQFRTITKDVSNIYLALEINDRSCNEEQLTRWLGEPLKYVYLPTYTFKTNRSGFPILNNSLKKFIQRALEKNVEFVITGANRHMKYITYVQYLQHLASKSGLSVVSAQPLLFSPQILSNDLSNVYKSFDKDNIKYKKYEEAIYEALTDRVSTNKIESNLTTIIVVSAGKGTLVTLSIQAAAMANTKVHVFAVEHNKIFINELLHKKEREWRDSSVVVIPTDARSWISPVKADIMVCGLLGSFGDNELCPEYLYPAQRNLKENGVCIPSEYTSYLSLVSTETFYNQVQNLNSTHKFERPYEYTAFHRNGSDIVPPQCLFTFVHPCEENPITYERYKQLHFQVKQDCVLHGLIGYFHTRLYKNITLSTSPETRTSDIKSLCPLFFPISTSLQLKTNSLVDVNFWRLTNEGKVWYEWLISKPLHLSIHNINGCAYFINKVIPY